MKTKLTALLTVILLLALAPQGLAQDETDDEHLLELSTMLGDFSAEYDPVFFTPEQGRRGAPLVSEERLVRPDDVDDWEPPALTSSDEVRLSASLYTPSLLLNLELVPEEVTVPEVATAIAEMIATSDEGHETSEVESIEIDMLEIAAFDYEDDDGVIHTRYVQQIDALVYVVWQVEHLGELSAEYREAVDDIIGNAAFEAEYAAVEIPPSVGVYSGRNGIVNISFTVAAAEGETIQIGSVQFSNSQGCTLTFDDALPLLPGVNLALFNERNGIIGSADGSYFSNAGLIFSATGDDEIEVTYSAALMCNTISTGMDGTLTATRVE
jgi:hypothetical protein